MLRVWNVSLIVATFALALLGTFLVRSGILESIHAFGASTVGTPLLVLIAIVIVGSAALIVSRLDRAALGAADRVAGLARGRLPGQQPAPGRALRGDLLGHLLPPDLRGDHGREVVAGLALVRPLHGAAGDPARALHRDRPAARLAAGERRGRSGGSSGCRSPSPWSRPSRSPRSPTPSTIRWRWRCSRSRSSPSPRWWPSSTAAPRPSGRSAAAASSARSAGSSPATGAATAATSSTPASRCC